MPIHTKPLTTTEIKNAKIKEKEYCLHDGHGLSLRIRPSGSKLWILNYYRPYTKQRANLGLGAYPQTSLSEARKLAAEAKSLIKQGIDPKEHREEQKRNYLEARQNTLEVIARQWLKVKEPHVAYSG